MRSLLMKLENALLLKWQLILVGKCVLSSVVRKTLYSAESLDSLYPAWT